MRVRERERASSDCFSRSVIEFVFRFCRRESRGSCQRRIKAPIGEDFSFEVVKSYARIPQGFGKSCDLVRKKNRISFAWWKKISSPLNFCWVTHYREENQQEKVTRRQLNTRTVRKAAKREEEEEKAHTESTVSPNTLPEESVCVRDAAVCVHPYTRGLEVKNNESP